MQKFWRQTSSIDWLCMKNFFDDCQIPEPSSLLGFSGNEIATDVEHRSESCLSGALDDKDSLYLAFCQDKVIVRELKNGVKAFLSARQLSKFKPDFSRAVMLGNLKNTAVVALPVEIDIDEISSPYSTIDIRTALYAKSLSPREAGAIGMAHSLLHWHKGNQFCGVCGSPSRSHLGGARRDCTSCEAQVFPRTDPVVIMLAVRGNKCLLGRSPHFPEHWYSCLAGFVEQGESIEQAVRRETREESGIKIGRVKYFASQPWPFPHSLMIGAYCEAVSDKIAFDGEELEDCRWFEREEVLAMIEKRHEKELRAPPSKSIASAILRNWLEQTN